VVVGWNAAGHTEMDCYVSGNGKSIGIIGWIELGIDIR